ncbi:DUF2842 domain-containing protein [Yoonia sp.]|uniref:DUF2842 domain-containing protein n=1 Tax=Yoonia sp. TaxID=2212373 RepID=UPI00358FCD24
MTFKARKRLAIFVLVIGLPVYIAIAATIMSNMMSQQIQMPKTIEFLVYLLLGIGWAFPLKWIFKGIGQPDPDAPPKQ